MPHLRIYFCNFYCLVFLFSISSLSSANESPLVNEKGKKVEKALIQTSLGDIEIELYTQQAPLTTSNFIRYIREGAFGGGSFYRVVRKDNDNGTPIIEVIQGSANAEFNDFLPVELESTSNTGIKHLDGVLSMARGEPNSATHEFFICIGSQPSLDKGGMRNPDGHGFAAFGKVIKGMEIVHTIHNIREAAEVEDDYVKNQILAKPIEIISVHLL